MTEKKKSGIYAGIVSFNPDLNRLRSNILSINEQTKAVIFDNGSNNINEINKMILEFEDVVLIRSEKNLGIATALNRLMQWGYDREYKWMLSLDVMKTMSLK